MVLDDEIQDKDVQNAPDAVEQAQWLQNIQRDFGSIEVNTFNKQLMLVKGTPSAKVYYSSLLKSFPTKIDNFIEFSKKYHDETGESNPSNEMLREAKPYFDKVHTTINGWKLLLPVQKLQKIREYQEAYRELVHFLAFQKVRYDYVHSALWYAIGYGAVDIAIDLIKTPGIDLNFYHTDRLTTVLMHAAYYGNYTIVRALCEMPGVDLHIKDRNGKTALQFGTGKNEITILLLYHMLKTATPDAAERILFINARDYFTKEAVYQHILSLVNETKDDNLKINILENAIAKVDGKPASALSYYFHVIKSPYNDIVKKIKDKIEEIKSNTKSKIEIVIEKPTITVEQINNRPEDKYIKPEVLLEVRREIESRSVSDLEFEEEMYAKNNGLIPEEETTRYHINKFRNQLRNQYGLIPFEEEPIEDSMTYIVNKNDADGSASSSQQQSHGQNRSIPIVSNTAPSNADHIHKTKTFPVYYLRTSFIGSLVVGLILGLILGFGFDLSTAPSAISAVVSAVSTFGLSLGSYYFAAKHMSSENDPLLFNVDKTNERELTLMNKSHFIDNSTNKMQNSQNQGVVAAPGAPGYATGRICQRH